MINVAAYWLALEEYTGRKFSLKELPVLVNGDDILFKSNRAFYEVWQKWIVRAGFTLSLGKNYISRDFLTINSEAWQDLGNQCFRHVMYLPAGLLLEKAAGKGVSMRPETQAMPIVDKLQFVIDNCNNPERAYDRIKHYWKKEIAIHTQAGYYNLCIPCELGGCGLRVPESIRKVTKVTKVQASIATVALNWYKSLAGTQQRTLPPNPYKCVSYDRELVGVVNTDWDGKAPIAIRPVTEPLRENEFHFKDLRVPLTRRLRNDEQAKGVMDPYCALRKPCWRKVLSTLVNKKLKPIRKPFTFDISVRKVWSAADASTSKPSVPCS
jgi:hypothetical protein